MSNPVIGALTLKSTGGHLNVLIAEFDVVIPNTTTSSRIKGIWDTGATNTVITKKVVDQLQLKPTGRVSCHTANGPVERNTYIINIVLANGVNIHGVIASDTDDLMGGCDALIGMDIINLGDFSITNHNGTTVMSFRVPSQQHVDYVADLNKQQQAQKVTQINQKGAPKHLGSGKKGGGSKFHL